MTNLDKSLDDILVQIGELGKYQVMMFTLVCIAVTFQSCAHVAYVFTAMDIPYRCRVPTCDQNFSEPEFNTPWLRHAVPFMNHKPKRCEMFAAQKNATESPLNYTCSIESFDRSKIEICDTYIFQSDKTSILQEYDLYCDDNLWKLAMVGTINNLGQFCGFFMWGYLSDKFGRKFVLIWSTVTAAVCGLLRTLAPTYIWFLTLEFFDAFLGSGTYACGIIIGVELVGPSKRVLTSAILSSCYAIGEILLAGAAYLVISWKTFIYIICCPPLLLISYYWIIPESIRWNLSRGKIKKAQSVLKRAAEVNGKVISEDMLDTLNLVTSTKVEQDVTFKNVLKSRTLLWRFILCCFCWIVCAFLFFGLTLNSVSLSNNVYMDFVLVALVEIPGQLTCAYILNKIGRRNSLVLAYATIGFSCLGFLFISAGAYWIRLCFYLVGKYAASASFSAVYIVTSELFPTPLRHSTMGLCSAIGRIGSMVAPQTPLLAQIWGPLAEVLFAGMAFTAGLLSLLFPETLGIKLPDTIEEAEEIHRNRKNQNKCQN